MDGTDGWTAWWAAGDPPAPVAPASLDVHSSSSLPVAIEAPLGWQANSGLSVADARTKRISTMAELDRRASAWLILSDDVRAACIDNDDAFDAFIASLVACAAATGWTFKPLLEQRGAAQREGWIHLPEPASLDSLARIVHESA